MVDVQGVEAVAITLVATLAWLALAWLLLALVLVAATGVPGRAGELADGFTRLLAPAATRRMLAAALGVTLITGMSSGAALASPRPGAPQPTAISTLDLDWPSRAAARPDRTTPAVPTQAPRADVTPAPSAPASPAKPREDVEQPNPAVVPPGKTPPAADDIVVVQRGDTLWSIAARRLGPNASEYQISREWPRWWSANQQVIGHDPDLIKPGQRLTPPPTER